MRTYMNCGEEMGVKDAVDYLRHTKQAVTSQYFLLRQLDFKGFMLRLEELNKDGTVRYGANILVHHGKEGRILKAAMEDYNSKRN